MSEKRIVSEEDGQALAAQWKCPFFETSAKLKINSVECFQEAVRVARSAGNSVSSLDKDGKQKPRRRFVCSIL